MPVEEDVLCQTGEASNYFWTSFNTRAEQSQRCLFHSLSKFCLPVPFFINKFLRSCHRGSLSAVFLT